MLESLQKRSSMRTAQQRTKPKYTGLHKDDNMFGPDSNKNGVQPSFVAEIVNFQNVPHQIIRSAKRLSA